MSASAMVSAHPAFATRFLGPVGIWPKRPRKPGRPNPRAFDQSLVRPTDAAAAYRGPAPGRVGIFDRRYDFGAELPGFGPGAEIPLRRRFRVGGIEHVALAFRATQ